MHSVFQYETLKERNLLEDLDVGSRIILKQESLNKQDVMTWI